MAHVLGVGIVDLLNTNGARVTAQRNHDYDTLAEVRASIQHFIEAVYNRKRLHSAIGYLPPAEFEASLSPPLWS